MSTWKNSGPGLSPRGLRAEGPAGFSFGDFEGEEAVASSSLLTEVG